MSNRVIAFFIFVFEPPEESATAHVIACCGIEWYQPQSNSRDSPRPPDLPARLATRSKSSSHAPPPDAIFPKIIRETNPEKGAQKNLVSFSEPGKWRT